MNLFNPKKRVKKVYFRSGENHFVLISIFIFSAYKQNWNPDDIRKVVKEARKYDYKHLVATLKDHSTS